MVSSPPAALTCTGEEARSGLEPGEERWKLLQLSAAGTATEEEEEEEEGCSSAEPLRSSGEEPSAGPACSLCG